MADESCLEILWQGTEVWNHWRRQNEDSIPDLSSANLVNTDLSKTLLTKTNLSFANLTDANLQEADLSNANLQDANLSGVKFTGANLTKAALCGSAMDYAVLNKATLTGTELRGVDLFKAYMPEANLIKADLSGAKLRGTTLRNASLREATLRETTLREAILTDCDFSKVVCGGTSFIDVDLSVVKGLETAYHVGPSHIDIDTLVNAKSSKFLSPQQVYGALRNFALPGGFCRTRLVASYGECVPLMIQITRQNTRSVSTWLWCA